MALYLRASKANRDAAVSPTPHRVVTSPEEGLESPEPFSEKDLCQAGLWSHLIMLFYFFRVIAAVIFLGFASYHDFIYLLSVAVYLHILLNDKIRFFIHFELPVWLEQSLGVTFQQVSSYHATIRLHNERKDLTVPRLSLGVCERHGMYCYFQSSVNISIIFKLLLET